MALLDTVEVKHHQCLMYNLLKSSAFFKKGYNHE